MFIKRVLLTHFIISLFSLIECGKCPPQEVMNPCICDTIRIICGGNQIISLKQIFQNISLNLKSKNDKHFDIFILDNTAITELEDNTFQDITFESIDLEKTKSLSKISSNAFSPYNTDTVERIDVSGHSLLGDHQYINDIFRAMTSLIKVIRISFRDSQLGTIPEYAFNSTNGLKNNLVDLNFMFNKIESVGDNAFSVLNNLTYLYLDNNQINSISIHAFDFFNTSENKLYISLSDNRLNDTSIELRAFTDAKRPLSIDLSRNKFTFFDERIFGPILRMDKRNEIYADGNPFQCDCRMYWLFKGRDLYRSQMLYGLICNNKTNFWSLTANDFNNCNGY